MITKKQKDMVARKRCKAKYDDKKERLNFILLELLVNIVERAESLLMVAAST